MGLVSNCDAEDPERVQQIKMIAEAGHKRFLDQQMSLEHVSERQFPRDLNRNGLITTIHNTGNGYCCALCMMRLLEKR